MSDRGVVLLSTFIVLLTLSFIAIGFLHMNATRQLGTGYDVVLHKALWVAEGGMEQVFYKLKNDSGFRASPTTVTGNLGDGSYSVTTTKSGVTYTITSTGKVEILKRKVTQTTQANKLPEAFLYVVHTGKDIDFEDSTGTITGDLSAGKKVKDEEGMTINGTVTENSTVVTPSVDLNGYKGIADHVVKGKQTFKKNQTYSGIWFVDGEVKIEEGVTLKGSLIGTKKIKFEDEADNVTITPTAPYPALVSGKDIEGEELKNLTIQGLIFAEMEIKFEELEKAKLTGSLVAGKNIKIEEGKNVTLTYDAGIKANPPPFFSGGATDKIVVAPQKDWNEIVPP